MELKRCNCPRQGKLHLWYLDKASGYWYHGACGAIEGPPVFFRIIGTDVRTCKDECFLCETKLELDVNMSSEDNLCLPCRKQNPEF